MIRFIPQGFVWERLDRACKFNADWMALRDVATSMVSQIRNHTWNLYCPVSQRNNEASSILFVSYNINIDVFFLVRVLYQWIVLWTGQISTCLPSQNQLCSLYILQHMYFYRCQIYHKGQLRCFVNLNYIDIYTCLKYAWKYTIIVKDTCVPSEIS